MYAVEQYVPYGVVCTVYAPYQSSPWRSCPRGSMLAGSTAYILLGVVFGVALQRALGTPSSDCFWRAPLPVTDGNAHPRRYARTVVFPHVAFWRELGGLVAGALQAVLAFGFENHSLAWSL